MTRESFWCLRQVCILDGLSERELQELSRIAPMRYFSAGQFIYPMGRSDPALYIIGEGEVTIQAVTCEGKEIILGLLKSGDVFGELFVPAEDRGQTEARARTDVWLCALTERDFLSLCARRPQVAINFIRVLMRRVHELQEEIEDLAFSTARQRFLKLLDRLCAGDREQASASVCIVRFSQDELARMLGVTRERVNAIVNEFKRQGVLQSRYGSLIVDRDHLRRVVQREVEMESWLMQGGPSLRCPTSGF
jgi:CRP/FNR family transcriptional regulator